MWFAAAVCSMGSHSAAAPQTAGPVFVRGGRAEVGFDARSGAIVAVRAAGRQAIAGLPGGALWRLHFRDGSSISSQQMPGRVALRRVATGLRLAWTGPRVTVVVVATPSSDAVDLTLRVSAPAADVVRADLPADLAFSPGAVRQVAFPSDLGIALKPSFFGPQGAGGPLEAVRTGPDGLQSVAGIGCTLRPGADPAVAVTVSPSARAILGDALAERWRGRPCVVNRPATRPPDLTLVDSPNGAYLAAHKVGQGWLVRFGGPLRLADGPVAVATAARLVAYLHSPGRRSLALLDVHGGPEPSAWSALSPAEWRRGLTASGSLAEAGVACDPAASTADLLRALGDGGTAAIVNPYGEAVPVGDEAWGRVSAAIRTYLQSGGVWVETGGWPFYSRLVPRRYQAVDADYPGGFCDFAHVDGTAGALALYGVQDARQARTILVPAAWRAWGDDRGAHLCRSWRPFVRRGGSWHSPPVRLLVGADLQAAVRAYADANGLARSLPSSVPPALAERWKRAVILAYAGRGFADEDGSLAKLPAGSIVHLSDYLRGGFDKQYPDLLPPNPARGTPGEFAALIADARKMGHLVMPYTNHTWWCDEPKGPTFERVGSGPLLRTTDGAPAREQYGPNGGWSVCPWHPAVGAAADAIVDEFTRDYPVDILFQDQVGARSWIWYDGNPASPTPWAYSQGLVHLSQRAAARVPLATENGFDRLLGSQAEFCGLAWRLVPFESRPEWLRGVAQPYRDRYAEGTWDALPLAHMVAGGAAFFTLHLGGPFTANRETLTWAMLLGMQATLPVDTAYLCDPWQRGWMQYVDRLQKAVGPRLMGVPLTSFRYLNGSGADGVMEAVYGDARVVANLTAEPWQDGAAAIAPMGFHVAAPGLEAGIFARYAGLPTDGEELWLVSERMGAQASLAAYAAPGGPVAVPLPGAGPWLLSPPGDTTPAPAPSAALPPTDPPPPIPAEWTRVAPLDRAAPPRYVGVISVDPDSPDLYSWAATPAADWVEALRGLDIVEAGRLEVRRIGTAEALAEALAHPADWLAIVNPYGERLVCSDAHPLQAMAAAVRDYVRGGGAWFETGGYPFFQSLIEREGTWRGTIVGPQALQALGLSGCAISDWNEDPVTLKAGDLGRQWLGDEWAASVRGEFAVANRPPLRQDYEAVVLQGSSGRPYLTGHQLGGWGWFFRFCGGYPDRALGLDAVRRLVSVTAARPLARLPVRSVAPQLATATARRR